MGITIHYHGKITDIERVEEFEDRVVDMALEIGASVRIWRSSPDHDATRILRGLILDVSPGQETTSLLLSPEGWLIPLYEMEAAESGPLAEPPHCCVKTQFGSIEGHVAIVELFSFLKQGLFPELYVLDESGYWENRDVNQLVESFALLRAAIDAMAEGLRKSPLSAEAAEDPAIVAARVERIARQVHQSLARPPEHPPVCFDDDDPDRDALDEAHWDAFGKEQRRRQERLHRAIEDELIAGADHTTAFENAMRNEGMIDLPGEPDAEDLSGEANGVEIEPEDESWRESLPPETANDDDPLETFEYARHPLQQLAAELHMSIFRFFDRDSASESRSSQIGTLMHGAGEISGGLAQALTNQDTDPGDLDRGLSLVQLKRALRGSAFASGALFALRAEAVMGENDFDHLRRMLQQLEDGIAGELARIRARPH